MHCSFIPRPSQLCNATCRSIKHGNIEKLGGHPGDEAVDDSVIGECKGYKPLVNDDSYNDVGAKITPLAVDSYRYIIVIVVYMSFLQFCCRSAACA